LDDLERLKVKVTNGAVTAIGMWGYTPVGLTGVLVYLLSELIKASDLLDYGLFQPLVLLFQLFHLVASCSTFNASWTTHQLTGDTINVWLWVTAVGLR